MRFWLSKNSEVPLREQLTTQIMLGVTSHDLKPGQRLPSTRELARRFRIHSNTVSAAYRELEARGWLELRRGSGVYVRQFVGGVREGDGVAPRLELDALISAFLVLARAHGHTLADVQARVTRWLSEQPPDHFLVVEPDEELRRILRAEVEEATGWRARGASPEELRNDATLLTGASVVALYSNAARARASLPTAAQLIALRSRSVPESLEGQTRPPDDALVSVVSRWPDFLHWARVVLVAAGIDPSALSFRDAREEGWQKGLRSSALVITDALTAARLPEGCEARVFRVVADSSLEELREFVGRFLSDFTTSARRGVTEK